MIDCNGFHTDQDGFPLFLEQGQILSITGTEKYKPKPWELIESRCSHSILPYIQSYLDSGIRESHAELLAMPEIKALFGLDLDPMVYFIPAKQARYMTRLSECFSATKITFSNRWMDTVRQTVELTRLCENTNVGCVLLPISTITEARATKSKLQSVDVRRPVFVPVNSSEFTPDLDHLDFSKIKPMSKSQVFVLSMECVLTYVGL